MVYREDNQNVCIEDILIELIKHDVSKEKIAEIKLAYSLAEEIHRGQFRQSGEEYITHPLNVAYNIINMGIYDPDMISAALLHDTIEDAKYDFTKEDIALTINPVVAELVDGVTKISRMNFLTEKEETLANTRKIINGLNKDMRIIIIKLADRLHNMRTLQYKSREKQIENARETMELFVPLALTIGAYRVKSELEDLAFKYLNPKEYEDIVNDRRYIGATDAVYLREIGLKIQEILSAKNIPNAMILRFKDAYTIYKKLVQGYKMENIYDLYYLKFLVAEVDQCYQTLAVVHRNNPPINGRFKDYIYNPKTNLYQSLHTTVSDTNDKLIKVKIRTFDMDKVAAYGMPALWYIKNGKTQEETQKELREKCQFAKKLMQLDEAFSDNEDFIKAIRCELLTEHVYVYTHSGEIIELPSGSTALDFACQSQPDLLDRMTGVIVNGREVALDHILKTNDRVQIITNGKINHTNWESYAHTPTAKQKIKLFLGQ